MTVNLFYRWLLPLLFAVRLYAVAPEGGADDDDTGDPDAGKNKDGNNDADKKDSLLNEHGEVDSEKMAKALKAGLGYDAPPADGDEIDKTPKPPVKQTPEEIEAARVAAAGKTAEEIAAEKVETDRVAAEKKAADDKARTDKELAAIAGKKADDLMPSPEERKAMTANQNMRIRQLHTFAKSQEAEVERLKPMEVQATQLMEARTALLTVLEDAHTTQEELGGLIAYNKALKTGDYETALKVVNTHRALILKHLGREEDGVDLLQGHDDLIKAVENEEITRNRAVELATLRNRNAAAADADERARQQKADTDNTQDARVAMAKELSKWVGARSAADKHYLYKEKIINKRVEDIVARYPPELWIPTIEALYETVPDPVVTRPLPSPTPPLRNSGGKPGPADTNDMVEAFRNAGIGQRSAAG